MSINRFLKKNPYWALSFVLLLSALARFYYVFHMTDYSSYLYSDFGGYWDRALQRYHGDLFNINQWVLWPAFPHIVLGWFFGIISLFGLDNYRLESVLFINILLSSLNAILLYHIAKKLLPYSLYAWAVMLGYLFYFPLVYFDAFVMSEHIGITAGIVSLYLLLFYNKRILVLFLAGTVLGIGVAARPSMGLYGLPYFFYILFSDKISLATLRSSLLFGAGFLFVLILAISENNHISHGKLKGLSANGGLTFYFSQCKSYSVESRANGYYYVIVPPSTVQYLENGTLKTDHPLYDQAYFYKKGTECLKNNPTAWLDNLKRFKTLFYGPLLPSSPSAAFFSALLIPSQHIALITTLLILLIFLIYRHRAVNRPLLWLLLSIVLVSFLTMYLFSAEQRYFYSLWFAILPLGLLSPFVLLQQPKKGLPILLSFALLLIAFYKIDDYRIAKQPRTVTMHLFQNRTAIKSLNQDRNISTEKYLQLNSIAFNSNGYLQHETMGNFGKFYNIFITFYTRMTLEKASDIEFFVVSDDGFALLVDEEEKMTFTGTTPAMLSQSTMHLKKGTHKIELRYFQGGGEMGIKLLYRIKGETKKHYIGIDSKLVHFSLPDKRGK